MSRGKCYLAIIPCYALPAFQRHQAALERHRGKTFYVTEKLDGTSFTAFLRQDLDERVTPEQSWAALHAIVTAA